MAFCCITWSSDFWAFWSSTPIGRAFSLVLTPFIVITKVSFEGISSIPCGSYSTPYIPLIEPRISKFALILMNQLHARSIVL